MLPESLKYLLEVQRTLIPLQKGMRLRQTTSGGINTSQGGKLGNITYRVGQRSGEGSYNRQSQNISGLGSGANLTKRSTTYSKDTNNPNQVYRNNGGTTVRRALQHQGGGGNVSRRNFGSRGKTRGPISNAVNKITNAVKDKTPQFVKDRWNSFMNS